MLLVGSNEVKVVESICFVSCHYTMGGGFAVGNRRVLGKPLNCESDCVRGDDNVLVYAVIQAVRCPADEIQYRILPKFPVHHNSVPVSYDLIGVRFTKIALISAHNTIRCRGDDC